MFDEYSYFIKNKKLNNDNITLVIHKLVSFFVYIIIIIDQSIIKLSLLFNKVVNEL